MRFLRVLLILLVIIYCTYAGGIYIFLSTSVFEKWVVLGPKEGILTVETGWSFIPGKIELRGVHLEIEDPNIHLYVDLPQAHLRVRLLKIFEKEVSIIHMQGPNGNEGAVSARLDLRSDLERKKYILEKKAIEKNEQSDGVTDGTWVIHMDRVNLPKFSGLSLGEWKYVGDAEVTGGFRLRPGQEAEIFQSRLSLNGGSITGAAKQVYGKADVRINRFSVPDVNGSEVYRYIHAHLEGKGTIDHIRFLNPTLAATSRVSLDQGAGKFQASVDVAAGIIQPGSKVAVQSNQIALKIEDHIISGKGTALWKVSKSKIKKPVAVLRLDLKKIKITRKRGLPLAHDGTLLATATTQDLDLINPFKKFVAMFQLAHVRINHLPRWNSLMPIGLTLEDGYGEFNFEANASSGKNMLSSKNKSHQGKLSVRLNQLKGKHGPASFSSRTPFFVTAKLLPMNLGSNEWEAEEIHVVGRDFNFKFPRTTKVKEKSDWTFHAYVERVKYKSSKKNYSLIGHGRVWMRDSWPVLEWLNQQNEISSFLYSAALKDSIRVVTDFSMHPGEVMFQNLEIQLGSNLSARGEIQLLDSGVNGAFVAGQGFLTVGVKLDHSKVSYSLFSGNDWLENEISKLRQGKIPRSTNIP